MSRLILLFLATLSGLWAQKLRPDDPLEFELKPVNAGDVARRKLSDYYDVVTHTLKTPGELNKNLPAPIPAKAINTLGDPLQGAWWVKRHYYKPLSEAELVAGPGGHKPPSMEGQWTVVGAKSEGITPGFVMVDSAKEVYYIKFDPLTNPEMATGADHIAIRLLYAFGYHVPENYLIEFPESILVLGKDVTLADRLGRRRSMTHRDLSEMLQKVQKTAGGKYRATASRSIPGKAVGPYRFYGTRRDDPNDYVPHEHRRDQRGLGVISAWIDHDDSRAINNYDALVEADGQKYVKHYILDLGSALGSGTQRANSPRSGGEYLFGWKQSAVQLFTLGLAIPDWAKAHYPHFPSIGEFEYERFDPETWVPEYPNPAFMNRLPDDEFWAAKQVMSMRDDEIKAVVKSAKYSDPKAEAWMIECLIHRRDKIGKAYYKKVLPLDNFQIRNGLLVWEDISDKAGFGGGGLYNVQWLSLDNAAGTTSAITGANSYDIPSSGGPYRVAHITSVSRPKQSVDVTLRFEGSTPQVVAIERHW